MDDVTHLLLQAGRGDRDTLARFVAATQSDVWRFCAAMLNRAEADEATQETFVRAWRSAPGFRADASARTWVLAIARRVCFRLVEQRDRSDRERAAAAELHRIGPSGADDPGEASALTALVLGLDPDRRSAFVLTQLLGLSYEEAARVSGCPVGTIRSRVARARRDLQRRLAGADAGEDTGGR